MEVHCYYCGFLVVVMVLVLAVAVVVVVLVLMEDEVAVVLAAINSSPVMMTSTSSP